MNNNEIEEVYNQLARYMKQNELGWILAQVEEEIALGHVFTEKISVAPDESFFYYDDTRNLEKLKKNKLNSKANFVISKPYSEKEKLELLIDSVEIGIVNLVEVTHSLFETISEDTNGTEIKFEPEADIKESFDLTHGFITNSKEKSEKLLTLLNELRGELKNAN